ncbi:MAG TPA: hypothetical protein VGJ06_17085 [Candidatus Acidoferrum sp.]|jgi:hypothetical protein
MPEITFDIWNRADMWRSVLRPYNTQKDTSGGFGGDSVYARLRCI